MTLDRESRRGLQGRVRARVLRELEVAAVAAGSVKRPAWSVAWCEVPGGEGAETSPRERCIETPAGWLWCELSGEDLEHANRALNACVEAIDWHCTLPKTAADLAWELSQPSHPLGRMMGIYFANLLLRGGEAVEWWQADGIELPALEDRVQVFDSDGRDER